MEQTMHQKLAKLREPLSSKSISWRVGKVKSDKTKGQALPYIKPRVIQDLLDTIIGPANWRNRFISSPMVQHASLICEIDIKVDGEWVTKSDGAQLDSFGDDSNDKEVAIKGAYSDSFKRAAVMWGIGRYLYDYDAPWVDLREGTQLTSTPKLPPHMLPEAERGQAKPEPEPKAVATAPAPAPAPAVQASQAEPKQATEPETKPAAAPVVAKQDASPVPSEADEARERASKLVDAAVSPAKPAQATAAADGAFPPGLPEGLNDEQLKTVKGLIEKINKKLPTAMLRNYVRGPKAQEALPEAAREYVLRLLDQADGKAQTA